MNKQDHDFQELVRLLVPINGLAPALQDQIIKDSEILTFRKRDYVFHQGSRDSYTYYLLEGALELVASDQLIKKLDGGTGQAFFPVAQLQPRQMSARATTAITVLRVNRLLLDKLLSLGGEGGAYDDKSGIEVEVIEGADADWVGSLLQSELFARVPASNISKLLSTMEAVSYKKGDVVVRQGDAGDYYYLIREGRCEVLRNTSSGQEIKLAELGVGESFGEEALVSDSRRNATVRMLSAGTLLRLTKDDFVNLIKNPLISTVSYEQGCDQVAKAGAIWLDVRFRDEHAAGSINGSMNVPLSMLRAQAAKLDHDKHYIAYCDTGSRSSVAAFVLTERGFEASYLEGGYFRYIAPAPAAGRAGGKGGAAKPKPGATVDAAAVEAEPAPAASISVLPNPVADPTEAEVRASVLKAELARAALALEEAKRLQAEAEAAKKSAERELQERLVTERQQLVRQAEKAIEARLQAERQRLNAEAEAARRAAEQEIEQRLRREREKLDSEARKATDFLAEARRLKHEIEEQKRAAELEAARQRREQEEQLQRIKTDADARLQAEKKRLEELYRRNAEELERIQAMKAEAEATLAADRQRLEGAARAQLELVQAQLLQQHEQEKHLREEAEAKLVKEKARIEAEARKQLEAAHAELSRKQDHERHLREEVEARLAAERRRLEEEARQRLEAGQAQLIQQQEQERKLREVAEARLAEERKKIEAEFLRNTAMLELVQREKAAAEAARRAAAQEAEEIIAEYRNAHEQARIIEQNRLQEELGKLADERRKLRAEMEEARRAREEAENLQGTVQQHLNDLQSRQRDLDTTNVAVDQIKMDIQTVKAEATAAAERLRDAVRIEERLEQARAANERMMEQTYEQQERLRSQLEKELSDWISEQEQQAAAANKRGRSRTSQSERIKRKAREAKVRTQLHDLYLLEELATVLNQKQDADKKGSGR
ncbi:MAG: cyclic nucleotide-binding domain-containing protein [Gammaproteobacteria bacterium]|nr:cyclic nucleotide-binding domain-containing protein [Gammaproteobacteria bacterium]